LRRRKEVGRVRGIWKMVGWGGVGRGVAGSEWRGGGGGGEWGGVVGRE